MHAHVGNRGAARPPEGGTLWPDRFSLAAQFLLASLVILLAGTLSVGAWVGQQIERGVVNRTAAITALYVDSIVIPYLEPTIGQGRLDTSVVDALDRLLRDTALGERIVAFKVWSPAGEVLYSPNRLLMGRRFEHNRGLALALRGEVTAQISDLRTPENEFERQHWDRLLEVYTPVRERSEGRIVAAAEIYQTVDDLEREIGDARLQSWAVVVVASLAGYALLAGVVKRGSDTIARQHQALREKLAELSDLLAQNHRLHGQLRRAAERTTALNERALRRISADLHDGPGQALALALLRLDGLQEQCGACGRGGDAFPIIHQSVRDALDELRAISAGLRLPELARLSVAEVAERAVRNHEQRSGTSVAVRLRALPAAASLPIKIALYRSLQEALANASRHAGGVGVTASAWTEGGWLCLEVSDRGPGFRPEQVSANGHLGLAGMRERASLLGGEFQVDSALGHGTSVRVRWPLHTTEEA